MDSEATDNSNKCETSENTTDSSSINKSLKEGVKKVHSVNSISVEDNCMEVDEESKSSASDKLSEKENGIHNDNSEKENQNIKMNNENATPNHEQSKDDRKDTSQNSDELCVQNEQNLPNKKSELNSELNSSKHVEKELKNDAHCDGAIADGEISMGTSSDKTLVKNEIAPCANSEKLESTKDDVRPGNKDLVSSELLVSDKVAENSSKADSSDKDSKDKSNSEVSSEAANAQDSKSKNTSGSIVNKESTNIAPSESKSENTKKEESTKKKKSKTCEECGTKKGLKLQLLFKGKTRFLCSDTCFKNFKSKQAQSKSSESSSTSAAAEQSPPDAEKCGNCQKEISGQGFYPVVGSIVTLCSEDCVKKYNNDNMPAKSCSQCKKVLEKPQEPDILSWETMVFCNEDCLGKFQSYLGSHCTCCQSPVPQASLGKYSVCFGADIRQFCSSSCLDDFKKNLKVCSFCQTDLSAGIDSFLAPVGDRGQFKDFCSQNCMERYEVMNNISKSAPQSQVCTHCKKQGTFKIQAKFANESYSLCSDMCVAGFRCTHKIKDKMCDTCYNFFDMSPQKDFSFKFDGHSRHFCTKACMTLFVLSHRKIVACVSCKVKKYNFDMIEKTDANNQTQIFCSLNCLSLYRVSVNATSSKSFRCDHCGKNLPAQYHLTMSDGSVRNFCTYNCVIVFQNQYTNVCTLTTSSTTRQTNAATSTSKTIPTVNAPVISNVVSLAPATPRGPQPTLIRNLVPPKLVSTRPNMQPVAIIGSKIYSITPATGPVLTQNLVSPKLDADQQPLSTFLANYDSKPAASSTITSPATQVSTVTNAQGQQVIREVIVKPPAPKSQKNKSVACKPIMISKSINAKPPSNHKAVQTDDTPKTGFIPIPVPIYIPIPLHMYSRPVPCPVPFPVPIPIPIFVPVSKETSNQEKKAQSKFFENMFALSEKPQEMSNASKNDVKSQDDVSKEASTSFKKNDDNGVKEAAVNVEPSSSNSDENDTNEVEDEYVFKAHHHGKRHHHHKNKSRKRSRTDDMVVEEALTHIIPLPPEEARSSAQSDQTEEAPRLKHTFGVNAWKQWVLQKNEQMIKGSHSSRKFKLFKTDLLQLPPDELNYSLSLFVKEVRKPNGEEYGSGSIYYLCLGIQKYLFQNGRLDNIFAEPHYEKFTECLNDILLSQDALASLEGFPSSRIEEEILWESKQLGAHSPYALLNTLMYFNTKYFKLKSVEDHVRLSFTHVEIAWVDKKDPRATEKVARLRYYPKDPRKDTGDTPYYEQKENIIDSMRCPVKLYEFYLSKIPECCKGRNDLFYLNPDRSCCPDNPVWYSAQPLGQDTIAKMMQRVKIVREVYEN